MNGGLNLNFDFMFKDEVVGHVEIVDNQLVENIVYDDCPWKHLCIKIKTLPGILEVLNERVMCEERWTPEFMEHFGLKEFNVYEILKKTHGIDVDDFSWIRFSGENITWNDVKVRG